MGLKAKVTNRPVLGYPNFLYSLPVAVLVNCRLGTVPHSMQYGRREDRRSDRRRWNVRALLSRPNL